MRHRLHWVVALAAVGLPATALCDTITQRNGDTVHGVIQKIADGKVTFQTGSERKVVDILTVEKIDFDTPHVGDPPASAADPDAQEMARLTRELRQTRQDLKAQLEQIRKSLAAQDGGKSRPFDAMREEFRAAMKKYQSTLQSIYGQVATQVDGYNAFASDAGKVHGGKRGLFGTGSPLLTPELEHLPIQQFMPSSWYDTIIFEGYRRGFREGVDNERLMTVPGANNRNQN